MLRKWVRMYPPEIAKWSEDQITRELIRQAKTQPIGVLGEIGTRLLTALVTIRPNSSLRATSNSGMPALSLHGLREDFGKPQKRRVSRRHLTTLFSAQRVRKTGS
jgi:hypothetical protein